MLKSTLTSKGQVTIPKKIRELLNVHAHDQIIFQPLKDGTVLLTTKKNGATALFGLLQHRRRETPVSVSDMDEAIHVRRKARGIR